MVTESQFVKYALKENDTLESVAKELHISIEYLMLMHNDQAIMFDKIKSRYEGFPVHLTEIFVTTEIFETYNKTLVKKRLRTPRTIFYRPTKKKLDYGVLYSIYTNDQVLTLKFETSINYIERTLDNKNHIIKIDRTTTTYFNDEDSSTLANELALKTASVLYPLQIITTPQGHWLGINNHAEIVKRWNIVKEDLYTEYEGGWVEQYIMLNENTIYDENILYQSLQKDWFLAAYFSHIYINHTDEYKVNKAIVFPTIAAISPIEFTVDQTLNEYLDDDGNVVIEQNGSLSDQRNKEDLENNLSYPCFGLQNPDDPKAEGQFYVKYFLNPESNIIESLYLSSAIELAEPQKIEIVIALIDKNTLS